MPDHPLRRATDFLPETPEKVAAQVVHDASKVAQTVVQKATETAAELAQIREESDERMIRIVTSGLKETFGEHEKTKRFVDVTRIPLICQSIVNMDKNINDIKDALDTKYVTKDRYAPVEKIAYALVGAVCLAVIGLLMRLL